MMVESEAKELSEDIMLGAVMFGTPAFQPVIDAIIELAEKAAKEPFDVQGRRRQARWRRKSSDSSSADLRAAYKITDKQDRYAAVGTAKEKVMAHYFPEGQEPKPDELAASPACSRNWKPRSSAATSSTPASASTAATVQDRAPDRRRSRRPAAHPRLGAVHPR